MSLQQRIMIATVLSLVFFFVFDYFVYSPQQQNPKISSTNSSAPTNTQNNQPNTSQPNTSAQNQQGVNSNNLASAAPVANSVISNKIATLGNEHFELWIDSLGRIGQFYLKDKQYQGVDGEKLALFKTSNSPLPLEIRFSDEGLNNEAFSVPYTSDISELQTDGEKSITLTQNLSKTTVTKKITFKNDGSYKLEVSLSNYYDYFITPGYRPDILADSYTFHGVLIRQQDDTLALIEDGDAQGNERYMDAKILANSDRYYTSAFYNFEKLIDISSLKDANSNPIPFIKGKQDLSLNGYIGPKDYKTLQKIDQRLTDIIEYGFFTFLAKPVFLLLNYFYEAIGNWGWAIVITTILIRLALYPLTYKGMVSMNKLKDLAPKIKEIQQKYKGEPQKMNMHMMELYKKHGANPMGGCLPILLQIPVFFAIYRVLLNAIELKSAEWILWINDLSVMDPYFVLPILMGITMFIQQRITPTNFTDPMQEKIMKYLPLVFTFFFVMFPAGLTLYWFINNLFSIAQQFYVNQLFEKQKAASKAKI